MPYIFHTRVFSELMIETVKRKKKGYMLHSWMQERRKKIKETMNERKGMFDLKKTVLLVMKDQKKIKACSEFKLKIYIKKNKGVKKKFLKGKT